MRCPSLEQLVEYQDGLCTLHQHTRISNHVDGCVRCQQEIAAIQRATQLLAALPPPPMPADLWPGVAERIAATPRRFMGPWVWRTMAGMGFVASMLIGFILYQRSSPSLPFASETTTSYVSQHQLLSARDPLADRASLGVLLASDQGRE